MKIHDLKIRTEYLDQILNGGKTFEIRKFDRDFCADDLVVLREHLVNEEGEGICVDYEPRTTLVQILDVFSELPGLKSGYCIFTFQPVKVVVNS